MEKTYKLGKDLHMKDDILDGFSFEDLITALQCNEEEITPDIVRLYIEDFVYGQLENARFLVNNNLTEIIKAATAI